MSNGGGVAAKELFGHPLRAAAPEYGGRNADPAALADRHEAFTEAMLKEIRDGLSGETIIAGDSGVPTNSLPGGGTAPRLGKQQRARSDALSVLKSSGLAKGLDPSVMAALEQQLTQGALAKEITLTSPVSTGLVPYDLEAPAKMLTPRPTPFRNIIPRVKGEGAARRIKVISGFTGTGTGGATTLQPGINESSTNAGPGGLSYIRPPYISYDGYDQTVNYVSWGLSDSVSWQAEFQGAGFQDVRSLSSTALLYSTMLIDERLMWYGRGTTGNGYTGALATASVASASVSAGTLTPSGSSTLAGSTTYWYVVAADGGDLLGTTGTFHQGPATAAASIAVTTAGTAIQLTMTDVAGALGYNMFVGSVSGGPFTYAGRTGSNVGYISAPPNLANGVTTSGAADGSAISTNFDGWLTNVAANGGYVKRLNAALSTTTPGNEFQTAFSSLYDAVKADPDQVWLNGHDRNQLSNALLTGNNVNNYRVYIPEAATNGIRIGAIVQALQNQITGKEVDLYVEPWMPQGNAAIRSVTLPIPDSNVSETSVMCMVQDYMQVQWPVQQFTYDSSVLEIGTMVHYAPTWQGLIQGILLDG